MPRILIVEDDKHIRRILESLLKQEGLEILAASDGSDGLKLLDQGPFALVITDLLMPRMDGFQFVRELRKHRHGNAPLFVASAIFRDPQSQLRLQQDMGPHQFFAKPFQVPELVAAVRKILGFEPAESPPPRPDDAPRSGSLAERSPPLLLLDAHERQRTVTLTLLRGKVRKSIAILHGAPVNVESNLRTETLGHFLVSRGILDESRHQEALARAQRVHEKLGRALLELGWIDEKTLLRELAAQTRAKIATVLRWNDGDWALTDGEPPADRLQTPVEAPRLVFSGLQKTAHVDEIAQALAAVRGRLAPLPRAEIHREAFARVFGVAALDALARRPLVEDLMAGADPAVMLVALDALLVCGMAQLEPAVAERTAPVERTDPVALERITNAPGLEAPQRNLYDDLFGSEDPSLVIKLPSGPARDRETLRKEILAEYLELPSRDHYGVLGVPPDAAPSAIAIAFEEKRARFAIERFANVDLGRDYARLEELHQAFQIAYDVLSSPARVEYDRAIAARNAPALLSIDPELLAGDAWSLLAEGDVGAARVKLEQAVAAAPDEASYRARLAWVLHLDGDPAGAWAQIELALAIDSDDAGAHTVAGSIAAAEGHDERAAAHLEKALETDPQRPDALATLEEVQARRGEWRRLERQYRKLIHRSEQTKSVPLWFKLAALYDRLGEVDSSKVAWQVCARLAPSDPRLVRMADLEERFRSLVAAQEWDAALVTASAMVARRTDASAVAEDAAELYRRYRPRFLQRAQAPLSAQLLASLLFPGERLPQGALAPLEELPPLVARVIAYARWLFGAAAPAMPLDPSLLTVENPLELGFLVGRALFAAAPRTSERLGLVVCNCPVVAVRLARDPGALVEFALSDPYLAVREELGLSVAV